MMNNNSLTVGKDNILTSTNFMKLANIVFSATLSTKDFTKLNLKNYEITKNENGLMTFINLSFDLKENDVIFCQSDNVEALFEALPETLFKNLKLITSQSDRTISKKLFYKRPKSISTWYATNVDYEDNSLISIPLGIAPYRNTKSIIFEDFDSINIKNKKNNLIYSNFNLNTNYFHRVKAYRESLKNERCFQTSFLTYENYLSRLSEYSFSLAPWGNGIDTHRVWESLYLGVLPITKNHTHFRNFKDIPITLIESYDKILTFDPKDNFNVIDYSKLDITWWKEKIYKSQVKENYEIKKIQLSRKHIKKFKKKQLRKKYIEKLKKQILTQLRKIHKRFNNLHKT